MLSSCLSFSQNLHQFMSHSQFCVSMRFKTPKEFPKNPNHKSPTMLCNSNFQKNSQRMPKEFPKNAKKISKEFLKKIQIIKFFQKIPKEFSKIHKKFWLAIIGRNPFWACYISLKEWNSVHILSKILNEKTFLS